ncbi:YceD family protein, partial [Klebsiella variicola]|uniref:YceD family protein n=1 Tax=Klebsiella variicola TaxID=244366 RepID=UPI00272F6A29
ALPRHLDARELIEDELLLALPLVPRHANCPQPLPGAGEQAEPEAEQRPNPFAALAALKRKGD